MFHFLFFFFPEKNELFSLKPLILIDLSPLRICTLILHIAKGIQAIHRIKAAHRDLKTKNVNFPFIYLLIYHFFILDFG